MTGSSPVINLAGGRLRVPLGGPKLCHHRDLKPITAPNDR